MYAMLLLVLRFGERQASSPTRRPAAQRGYAAAHQRFHPKHQVPTPWGRMRGRHSIKPWQNIVRPTNNGLYTAAYA